MSTCSAGGGRHEPCRGNLVSVKPDKNTVAARRSIENFDSKYSRCTDWQLTLSAVMTNLNKCMRSSFIEKREHTRITCPGNRRILILISYYRQRKCQERKGSFLRGTLWQYKPEKNMSPVEAPSFSSAIVKYSTTKRKNLCAEILYNRIQLFNVLIDILHSTGCS